MRNTLNRKKYSSLRHIQKRDDMIVPFDEKHITRAIFRAMQSVKEGDEIHAEKVMHKVLDALLLLRKERN